MNAKLLLCAALATFACAKAADMKFEAEDVIANMSEAVVPETPGDNKWALWSTDINADNWSGKKVIRSPFVKEDRQKPEDGAPVLRFLIPIPEDGNYNIELHGSARPMAISLDNGNTWRKFNQGKIISNKPLTKGTFNLLVDDKFAADAPNQRGNCYVDYFVVTKSFPNPDNLPNYDFEIAEPGSVPPKWSWWHRTNIRDCAKITTNAHGGKYAIRIITPKGADWAFTNSNRIDVKPGQCFEITVWSWKRKGNGSLAAVGLWKGETVSWQLTRALFRSKETWKKSRAFLEIPEGIDQIYLRVAGSDEADISVDDISIAPAPPRVYQQKPQIQGYAFNKERIIEKMGRGVFAQSTDNGAYISWRLLKEDPVDVAFNIFRKTNDTETKLNSSPITQTCDWIDKTPVQGCSYIVRPINAKTPGEAPLLSTPEDNGQPYQSIKLADPENTIQKVAVADLNGDGKYDYIVKTPSGGTDPWSVVWFRSAGTVKIEAYLHDGTHLWTNDLGWSIEQGVWYSPFIACDLNGDGKAEVIAKIGEGDPRDEDGRVYSGPEWFAVWDGMTGKEIARAPWPSREPYDNYNLSSRNFIITAYLDGKTPCLVILRGTYSVMVAEAWQLNNNKLEKLWDYSNEELGAKLYGQGAHTNYAVDLDYDGRDEIILGSAILDDNGSPLWTTGKGHPDGVFFGDLMPARPGHEIGYIMETPQKTDGICYVDAKTGKVLWGLDVPTNHVDGKGTCANVDPRYRGNEMAGSDMAVLEPGTNKRGLVNGWLFNSDGKLLYSGKDMLFKFGRWTLYWDADLQKEIFNAQPFDYRGGAVGGHIRGSLLCVADILGDWREEVLTAVKGELRIYSTPIPAMDRRPCLMQELNYRNRIISNAMGYNTEALLPYDPEWESPNINLTFIREGDNAFLQVVAVASGHEPITGKVLLMPASGVTFDKTEIPVSLKAGERVTTIVTPTLPEGYNDLIKAEFHLGNGKVLKAQVPARQPGTFLKNAYLAEAENFTEQTGGKVQIRSDKPNVHGKSISHWDAKGHKITWKINVPKDGNYLLKIRYSNPLTGLRHIWFDGKDYGIQKFQPTGGFGDNPFDWDHFTLQQNRKNVIFNLKAGTYTLIMENVDEKGNNLDYIALSPTE